MSWKYKKRIALPQIVQTDMSILERSRCSQSPQDKALLRLLQTPTSIVMALDGSTGDVWHSHKAADIINVANATLSMMMSKAYKEPKPGLNG
jgi:hypothetical protein